MNARSVNIAFIALTALILFYGVSSSQVDLSIPTSESPEDLNISTSEGFTFPSLLNIENKAPEEKVKVEPEAAITSIEVTGNKLVATDKVLEAVFSRVGDAYLEIKAQSDVKAIYNLGYFSDVASERSRYKGGIKLSFKVVENPLIRTVVFEGNLVLSSEVLSGSMETKAGDILNYTKLREDMKKIDDLYHSLGYILARVIDVSADQGILRIKIIEGVIESVDIAGNESTKNYVILRELNTKDGSVLNEKTLSKDLRRVFNLGFFSEVNPTFVPGGTPDKVKLVVNVKEQRTNTINVGGGYGEREGWFGFADLSVNNLFGTGQAIMIRGQTGTNLQTYQFKYYNPWVLEDYFGDHLGFTFKRWYTVGTDFYFSGQNEIHNGYDLNFSKPFADVWRAGVGFGGEWVGPYSGSSFEAYDTNTIDLSMSYDTRDILMNPTEGQFHTVSTRWGWKFAGDSATQFMKYGLDFNFFVPLAERQVLAFHAGTGLAVNDVPIGELYWVGGANTVRGYYPSEARTGRRKLLMNAEYRYTFNEVFQAVVFLDYGNAWDDGPPNFSDFLSGKGLGVRINTPLGPIRLDWGVASGKNFGDGVLHFSIGQAF